MSHRTLAAFLVAFGFSVWVPSVGAQVCDPPGGVPYQPDPRREPFEVLPLPPVLQGLPAADVLIAWTADLTPGPTNTTLKMKVKPWRKFYPGGQLGCDDRDYHLQPGEIGLAARGETGCRADGHAYGDQRGRT